MVDGVSTAPVFVDDEVWIYYSGFPHSHADEEIAGPNAAARVFDVQSGGIGLARLRLDGFVSLDGDDRGGTATTKPFTIDGRQLWVNADAARGELACEFLDGVGDPMAGFSRDDCVPCSANSVRHQITWKGQARVPAAGVGLVRLRFYLRDARLFSFWFES